MKRKTKSYLPRCKLISWGEKTTGFKVRIGRILDPLVEVIRYIQVSSVSTQAHTRDGDIVVESMEKMSLIKQQVIIMSQQTDDACAVVNSRPYDSLPVSTLEIGLNHLIIFTVAQSD